VIRTIWDQVLLHKQINYKKLKDTQYLKNGRRHWQPWLNFTRYLKYPTTHTYISRGGGSAKMCDPDFETAELL